MKKKIPQLRVVLTTECGKRCRYCRPSGEAACGIAHENRISVNKMLDCIRSLVEGGIQEVRLTGGDPAFYSHEELVWLVGELSRMNLVKLSLITRSGRIRKILPALKQAGLSNVTFSLDSMDVDRWVEICGLPSTQQQKAEHGLLLETIDDSVKLGYKVNLNCVFMSETYQQELPELVAFAKSRGIDLKIEEVIRDIGGNGEKGSLLHADIEFAKAAFRQEALRAVKTFVHGGLGHPMDTFYLDGEIAITWKTFAEGACYGPMCRKCPHFPCDDALMALRLLPDGSLQTCLKRDDNLVNLYQAIERGDGEATVDRILGQYAAATRLSSAEIEALRMARRQGKAAA